MAAPVAKTPSAYGCAANFVSLKPVEVPQALQSGEKFIKWDEVSTILPATIGSTYVAESALSDVYNDILIASHSNRSCFVIKRWVKYALF